jgi:putative hemolysin
MKTQLFGKYLAIAALVCIAIVVGSCMAVPTSAPSTPVAATTSAPAVGMANPASVFCKEQGGQLRVVKDAKGNEYGMCIFPDGSQCEEWAFYRKECKPGQPLATPSSPATAELTEASLQNARYSLPDLGAIELKDGRYEKKYGEGATQVNTAGYLTAAFGDLNGDGVEDAAAVVWWSGGGSGTFVHLAAMLNDRGAPRQAAVIFLGDRTNVETLAIKEGKIIVAARERLAQTAIEKQYVLQDGKLILLLKGAR